jgi:transcriptional regulator GlxA family with amidase domain
MKNNIKKVGVLLFHDFETLDVFGPVEIFGRLTEHYKVSFYSLAGGLINNKHGVSIITKKLAEIENGVSVFLIPGGYGTRVEVNNSLLIDKIELISRLSKNVLTVCTGTSLLAKTGLLDGRKATSNKIAFDWVTTQGLKVNWVRKARWVVDDKYYTSSGVSAGMDMTLGFIKDIHGLDFARVVAHTIEYTWQEDKEADEFCNQ